MSGVGQLGTSGPLILALPVAAAAGAVTFLSPCCLPLVPGYLSFVTGMAGAGGSPVPAATAAPDAGAPATGASAGGSSACSGADGPGGGVAPPPPPPPPVPGPPLAPPRRGAARTGPF